MILSKKIVSSWMDLGECPLSKEELLQLVEEEAALRMSASFLEQGGQEKLSKLFFYHLKNRWNKRKERA